MPSPSTLSAAPPAQFRAFLPWLGAALLIGLVIVLYWQRPQTFFILDDLFFVINDSRMHARQITLDGIMAMLRGVHPEAAKRPIPLISLMIDWWRGNGTPGVFYSTNVALHCINTVLVFFLARQIALVSGAARALPAALAAFFAAALWAAHPIHLTAVAYFWQRSAEMSALGALGTLLFYLHGRMAPAGRARTAFYATSLLFWLLGSISKENAWITPALVLLLEWGVVRNHAPTLLANKYEKAALGALTGIAALIIASIGMGSGPVARWLAQGYEGWDFSMAQRLLTEPSVVVFYLSQWFWPAPGRFAIEHDFTMSQGLLSPPATVLGIGFIFLWSAAGLFMLTKPGRRLYGSLLLFPMVALSIESSIVPIDIIFEYRMYLPSVALAILLAVGLLRLPSRIGMALGAAMVLGTATCLIVCLQQWDSPLTVYARAAAHSPTSVRVQYNYANELLDRGQFEEALARYDTVFSVTSPSVNRLAAIKIKSVHFNRALALLGLKRVAEAEQVLEVLTRDYPDYYKAHAILVDLYLKDGQLPQALAHADAILLFNPSDVPIRQLRDRLAKVTAP